MSEPINAASDGKKKIVIKKDGPYLVFGSIPLVHKTQVVSENGEPLTWKKDGDIETGAAYSLCRCGSSKEMPFCDGCHKEMHFDGTETAKTDGTSEFQITYPNGTHLIVKMDDIPVHGFRVLRDGKYQAWQISLAIQKMPWRVRWQLRWSSAVQQVH